MSNNTAKRAFGRTVFREIPHKCFLRQVRFLGRSDSMSREILQNKMNSSERVARVFPNMAAAIEDIW